VGGEVGGDKVVTWELGEGLLVDLDIGVPRVLSL